ncbi:MAG: hypothetical protein ACJZ59_03985 [Candidatus Thalassarchaeaceae archaeon]
MNTVSKTLFLTFLFVLGTISGAMLNDGYGQISDDSDTYDTSARNIGVLTDAQQQSMLNNQSNYGANDNDGDGLNDSVDPDDDNDCVNDTADSDPEDFDNDGINDADDIDDDGDGLNDTLEVTDSNTSTNIYDYDNDGNHDCAFFSTGGSSGGNSGNTGCGYDSSLATVQAWVGVNLTANQTIPTLMQVSCLVYNSTMTLDYWIYDSANSTLDSGLINWSTSSAPASYNHWWNATGLSVGNYTFHVELFVNGSLVDTDSDGFTIVANNSGGGGNQNPCGTQISSAQLFVFSPGTDGWSNVIRPEGSNFTGFVRPNCPIVGSNNTVNGYLSSDQGFWDSFTWNFYSPTNFVSSHSENWTNLQVGNYSFNATWWHENSAGAWIHLDEGWFNFTVIANTSGSPGSSQMNPLMPFNCTDFNWNATWLTLQDCQNNPDAFWFAFNQSGGTFWIDPVVAVGYDYHILSGPNATNVVLPLGYGDDIFELWIWDIVAQDWVWETNISANSSSHQSGGYDLTDENPNGVAKFSIRGIEISEGLDPDDPTEFATGITFATAGQVIMTMDPVTVNVNSGGGNAGCSPEVSLESYTSVNGNDNLQTDFEYGVDGITLAAEHSCIPPGEYYWNSTIWGPSGEVANTAYSGTWNITENISYDIHEFTSFDLSPGDYTWGYGFGNWSTGHSIWTTYSFSVVDNGSSNPGNWHEECTGNNSHTNGLVEGWLDIRTDSTTYSGNEQIITEFEMCWRPVDASMSFRGWLNDSNGNNIDHQVHSGYILAEEGHRYILASSTYSTSNSWDYNASSLSPGTYCWEGWFKVYDYTNEMNFLFVDWDSSCFEVTDDSLGSCSFPTFEATPYALYAGDDLTYNWSMSGDISSHVYLSLHSGWGTQYYYSGIVVNDGSHTITLPTQLNPNLDYTVYIESAFQDGRTTLCWKYGAIDILGSNEGPLGNDTTVSPTVDLTPRISMWFGKVNQHNDAGTWMTDPDGVAGAGSYDDWGDEGWGDRKLEYCQRFWPDTVDVVLRDSPEEIVFYTRHNTDAYLSTKPVWECVLDGSQIPELTGVCSFDLTITPTELEVGDTLTVTWTMTGDIPVEVGIAFFSTVQGQWNVGVQYHLSEITANDGAFAYPIPQGMNPDRDYYMYIDAESTDDFTTYCWKYGSFDILASNEGALEEVLENLFNSTDRTPRISMWYGKVNQHNENGTWMTDPDGTAGAGTFNQFGSDGWGDRKLEYCQRFWPDTVSVAPMSAEQIVFYTRGNQVAYLTTKPVWQCVQDTDGDGILDPDDADDDGDGWSDILEQACGTNELDVNDVPTDSDGDQICDLLDEALDDASEDDGGFLPGFSAIGGLAALGAAMLIGRRRVE